jgi:hypothetical protein
MGTINHTTTEINTILDKANAATFEEVCRLVFTSSYGGAATQLISYYTTGSELIFSGAQRLWGLTQISGSGYSGGAFTPPEDGDYIFDVPNVCLPAYAMSSIFKNGVLFHLGIPSSPVPQGDGRIGSGKLVRYSTLTVASERLHVIMRGLTTADSIKFGTTSCVTGQANGTPTMGYALHVAMHNAHQGFLEPYREIAPVISNDGGDALFTFAGHPFEDGDKVTVVATGYSGTRYVVSRTANTFKVSTTRGGAAVAYTTSPSAVVKGYNECIRIFKLTV